jgi:hypothetical protein
MQVFGGRARRGRLRGALLCLPNFGYRCRQGEEIRDLARR